MKNGKRWLAKMDEMNLTHLSRESWFLFRKLGAAQPLWKESKDDVGLVAQAESFEKISKFFYQNLIDLSMSYL